MKKILTGLCLAASVSGNATAHVVWADTQAAPGAYYFGFLGVGHGCDGAATTGLIVTIPEGVYIAKPQPKPGWTVTIERKKLLEPAVGPYGSMLTDRVSSIRFEGGNLADNMFDQFGLMLKLPEVEGPLYFPVTQVCTSMERRWNMIPSDGQTWHSLDAPAPALTVIKPVQSGTAAHH